MRKLIVLVVLLAAVLAASANPAAAKPGLSCTVRLLIGGQPFTGVVTRSEHTSCPFARRVAANSLRFIVSHGGSGDGDFYVFAYSPVTFKNYRMHCFAHGDIDFGGITVDCRGGIGARVVYVAHRPEP